MDVFAVIVSFSVVRLVRSDCLLKNYDGESIFNNGNFIVQWKVDKDDTSIDILLSTPMSGSRSAWLALGLSEVGGMLGSDTVSVEFSSKNDPVVIDRYVPWVASPMEEAPLPIPIPDARNDWTLKCAGNRLL